MAALAQRMSRILEEEQASTMVETSVALVLGITMVLITFELCMFVYTQAILGDAARAGVRYAVVHGTDSSNCSGPTTGCGDQTGTNVITTVQNYAAGSLTGLSTLTVTPSYPDNSSKPPSRVMVTVTYTYTPFFQSQSLALPMTALSEGRIVY